MLRKEIMLKVEVIWALQILVISYSFHSSAGKGELFSAKFRNSKIANFKWAKLKQDI